MEGAAHVVGIDGCPGGWAVYEDGIVRLVDRVATLFDREVDAIGIDIPIGLPPPWPRPADLAARTFLGPRWSTVFLTAPRPVLEASTHADALRRSRALTGKGVSQQAWRLGPRILDVDAWKDDPRLIEVHPEVSFRELAGADLPSKRTPVGLEVRAALLARTGYAILERRRVPLADALDAAVVAWTTERWARGVAVPLPGGHPRRVGAIWR